VIGRALADPHGARHIQRRRPSDKERLMSSRRLAVAVLLALLAGIRPGVAQDAASLRFGAEGFTLANGLQVVVIPNHRATVVTQMVWYKVGAADEPRGKSGIAHFLEHLMFRGTKDTPPGMFSRLVAQNGGRDNAFTGEDYTAYHQTVALDRLPLVMKLESDRMANLVITDAVVLPEREVIIEERRSRIDNSPAALLNEQVNTAIYLHHPYRIPTIGWEHEMQKLSTQDALDFYRTWYAPNNAVLVIAGDVTVAQMKPLAEQYYGPIAAKAVPARDRVSEPPKVATTRLESRSPRVTQASWTHSYLAPSYTGGESKYAYALQVLAQIVGDGPTSRLYRSLVLGQTIAQSAGAYYDPSNIDLTTFGFYARPRDDISVETVERSVEAEIKNLLAEGVTREETERAKSRMVAAAVYARDSLSGPANMFGTALATGRSIEDVEAWPERIAKVTVDEVNDAAKYVIHENVAVTGVLLPDRTIAAARESTPEAPVLPGASTPVR
jgi:zinc protease